MTKRGKIVALIVLIATIGSIIALSFLIETIGSNAIRPETAGSDARRRETIGSDATHAQTGRLQFRPEVGKKQTMRVAFGLATTHPARAGQDVTEHAWTFTVELEPLAIAPDGSVTIKVGILRAREEFFMHRQSDIRHHRDTAEGGLGGADMAFLGETFAVVVSPQGELIKLDTDAFYAAIAANRIKHEDRARQTNEKYRSRQEREQAYKEEAANFLFYGTNQLRTLLTNLLAPLAAGPVQPGDGWPGPVMLRLEGFMELAGTYTFKGLESGVCTLQAEARRSMDDQPIGPPLVRDAPPVKLAGTYQATIKVDPSTGSLLSKEAVMELEGTAPMPNGRTRTFGGPVPITTKATVTVEPVQ